MAKFCTKCGKPLEKGTICSCQEKEKNKKETINNNVIQDYGKLSLELAKGIFIRPVDTIKKYSKQENFIFAIVALFINSMMFGLLYYCILKEGNQLFEYNSLFSIMSFDVPFLQTFLQSTLFMIVGFATSTLSIYVLSYFVLKSNVDVKQITTMVGIGSIFTTITTAVTILATFISMKLTILLLLVSGLIYWTNLYQGIWEVTKVDKNKLSYLFASVVVITIFIVFYLLPKILF